MVIQVNARANCNQTLRILTAEAVFFSLYVCKPKTESQGKCPVFILKANFSFFYALKNILGFYLFFFYRIFNVNSLTGISFTLISLMQVPSLF